MSENKMAVKPMYKCGICDEVHESIEQRMLCEQKCLAKQKEEAKKALEKKRKNEEIARHKEVCEAIDKTEELIESFIEDYGYFKYSAPQDKLETKDEVIDLLKTFGWMFP